MRDATHSSHQHETATSEEDRKGVHSKNPRTNPMINDTSKSRVVDSLDWEQGLEPSVAQFLMCDHQQQPQRSSNDEGQSNFFQGHQSRVQEPSQPNEEVPPDPPPIPHLPPPQPLPPLSMLAHDSSRTGHQETQFQYQFPSSSQNQHHSNAHQGRPSRVCLPSISTSCPRTISVSSNESDYYCDRLTSSPDDPHENEVTHVDPSPTGEWAGCRDPRYWERRRKNNLAAKKSRDARRVRENQLRIKVLCLENANQALRNQVAQEREANATLRSKIRALGSKDDDND